LAVTDAEGDVRRAGSVILAVRPAVAASLVRDSAALAAWAERAIPVRAACLDVGLRSLPNPKVGFGLGFDEPLYFSVHTRSARLAPEGGATIHVARYLGPEPPPDPAAAERELEALLDLAQPGWREEVIARRYLPNMIVVHWLPAAESGGTAGRPGPAVPDVPGLFVAGDWVGPEGQLADAALASGRAAARLTLEAGSREYAVHG
jgi:phytoene dehydrogenase-like protein